MPDDNNTNPENNRDGESGGQQGGSQFASMDDALKYIAALEKRVSERTEEKKSKSDEVQQLRDELKEHQEFRQKFLEQQGQFQTLAEERAKKIAELEREAQLKKQYESILQAQVEAQIAQLPEDSRDLMPEGLSLHQQYALLNKIVPKLTKPPAPDFDAGAGGTATGIQLPKLTDYEKKIAEASGMTVKEYAEYKSKQGQAIDFKKKDE